MPVKAKFTGNFHDIIEINNRGLPIELYLFLSMGKNGKGKNIQSDEYLEAFVKQVIG
jgi:hypothetical protein